MPYTIDKLFLSDWKSRYVGKRAPTQSTWGHNNNNSFPISVKSQKKKLESTAFI